MGISCNVSARAPEPITGADLRGLAESVGPLAADLEWGCEPFMVPGKATGDRLEIYTKIQQADDEHTWRDLCQCLALTYQLSRMQPAWLWEVTDDLDLLSASFGAYPLRIQDGQAVRCDDDGEVTGPDDGVDEAVREALAVEVDHRVLEGLEVQFDDDHDDGDDERGAESGTLAVVACEDADVSAPIRIEPGSVRLSYTADDYGRADLRLEASITTTTGGEPVEVTEVIVVFRDAAGELLDVDSPWLGVKVKHKQYMVLDLQLPVSVVQEAREIDLIARSERNVRGAVATAVCEDVVLPPEGERRRVPLTVGVASDATVDLVAACYLEHTYDDAGVDVALELRARAPGLAGDRELLIALLGADGKRLAKETAFLTADSELPTGCKMSFSLPLKRARKLAAIELTEKADLRHRSRLARLRVAPR